MKHRNRSASYLILLGDIIVFVLALWLTLYTRYRVLPTSERLIDHLIPFSFIFGIWLIVFLIADLYHRPTIFRKQLSVTIINAQLANSVIAIAFFYFIPYFGITPKVTLFIDLLYTIALIFLWRRYLLGRFQFGRKEKMLFVCRGREVEEIKEEINSHQDYNIALVDADSITSPLQIGAATVVIDPYDQSISAYLPDFYRMIFRGVRFVSVHDLYEELFDRIPVSIISERWFIENISNQPKPYYDFLKQLMDFTVALGLGLISLIVYPFVWLAIKLDDGGPIFYSQERVGKNGRVFLIHKFRSMSVDEKEKVTRVGRFLRKSRIDELPQLWDVVRGTQSLIGPRPEMPAYVAKYREQLPYYDARHLIAPGLSGWAQIYHGKEPKFQVQVEATRDKLSYDLFYVKHRSLWLDITIALKTIKTILSVVGK